VNGETIKAEDQFFSPEDGGVVCPACGQTRQGVFPISLNALKVLRFMIRSPYDALRDLKLSPDVQAELERLTQRTITFYLEQQLKSVDFLKLVRRTMA
jgi:DNA repair protein RecO (recombination protein O)